jgi:hypothetical protein
MSIVLTAIALIGVSVAYWATTRRRPPPDPTPAAKPDEDPRLTYQTPYRNVRPEVQYVGSAVCAGCHKNRADSYAHHSMGRSFDLLAQVADNEPIKTVPCKFEKAGTVYEIERREGRFIHKATRRGSDGKVLFTMEADVPYVMGSGVRGKSYLVNHEGPGPGFLGRAAFRSADPLSLLVLPLQRCPRHAQYA